MSADTSRLSVATRRLGPGRLLPAALLAAGVAAAANLGVYAIARGLFDVSFVMPYGGPDAPPERLPAAMVAIASAVPAVAAAALLWGLGRFAQRPLTVFRMIALLALLASLGGPLSLAETETSTRVALVAMHVVAAAVIVSLLATAARRTKIAP